MTPELREACRRAVHVVTADGAILRAGRAALFILRGLGWPVGILTLPPLVWIVELGYRFVAGHRPAVGRFMFRRASATVSRR